VRRDEKVLLIKRGGEPWKGLWAPPGGGVELGETVFDAGKREVLEEAGIKVEITGVQEIEDFIRHDTQGKVEAHTVIIRLFARYISGKIKAGSDAADVGWYAIGEMDKLPLRPHVHELVNHAMSQVVGH
jgi:ADP-ribose pyrophosphatase YjhB (NUDIX family)